MPEFLEPKPYVLAFLAFKQVGFLPLLIPLALLRAIFARGPARLLGLLALLLALAGIAAQVLPAYLGIYTGTLPTLASQWKSAQGGMVMLLAAALPLAISAVAPGRRWWGIDLLHLLLLAALGGLWLAARLT